MTSTGRPLAPANPRRDARIRSLRMAVIDRRAPDDLGSIRNSPRGLARARNASSHPIQGLDRRHHLNVLLRHRPRSISRGDCAGSRRVTGLSLVAEHLSTALAGWLLDDRAQSHRADFSSSDAGSTLMRFSIASRDAPSRVQREISSRMSAMRGTSWVGTKSAPRSCPLLVPDYGEVQTLARLNSGVPGEGRKPVRLG